MTVASAPRLPDFFLVGAAKSGTTALAARLDEHPEVFVCKPKEPNYFAFSPDKKPQCLGPADPVRLYDKLLKHSVTTRSDYVALFAEATTQQRIGDASVRYLYSPDAASRIAADCPAAKIIALLRDPVERMHSHFHMNVQNGLEPLTFHKAVEAEPERTAGGWGWDWHYGAVGRYGEQLARYFEQFGRDQLLVLFHAELRDAPTRLWQRVCSFLEIDASFEPDLTQQAFVGKAPKSRRLMELIWEDNPLKSLARTVVPASLRKSVTSRINAANRAPVPRLAPADAARYRDLFAEDGKRLEALLGRSLPW